MLKWCRRFSVSNRVFIFDSWSFNLNNHIYFGFIVFIKNSNINTLVFDYFFSRINRRKFKSNLFLGITINLHQFICVILAYYFFWSEFKIIAIIVFSTHNAFYTCFTI